MNALEVRAAVAAVRAVPVRMATAVRAWLPDVTLERYLAFVEVMFHYTKHSGDRLRDAAERCALPDVRASLLESAAEENEHYRLAEADLAAFDRVPGAEPPPEVVAFEQLWASLAEGAADLRYLGALAVLEGVAEHIGGDARAALGKLGLEPRQARFVLVHLHADAAHGAQFMAMCRQHAARDPAALVAAAEAAGDRWIAMHARAFARG